MNFVGLTLRAMLVSLTGLAGVALAGEAYAAGGWQTPVVVNVPTGIKDYFFHRGCPAGVPVPVSGGFHLNVPAKTGFVLVGSFRRDDAPGTGTEWGWIFDWPAGAPAGSQVTVNIYCKRS